MKNYRIAIIGLGGMGRHHGPRQCLEANCELVAGAEIDSQRGGSMGRALWRQSHLRRLREDTR